MQLGSGTFSFVPGLVYLGSSGQWAWEVESLATVRLGSNDGGYTLGNRLATTFWAARQVHSNVSVSGRVTMGGWSDIDGADSDLNPMMVPTADPLLRAGQRLDIAMGINAYFPSGGPNKGARFGLEAGLPVRQWLDGPHRGLRVGGGPLRSRSRQPRRQDDRTLVPSRFGAQRTPVSSPPATSSSSPGPRRVDSQRLSTPSSICRSSRWVTPRDSSSRVGSSTSLSGATNSVS